MNETRHTIQIAIGLVAVFAAASSADAGEITLWRQAVVTDDTVTLGDVAQLEGFDAVEQSRLAELDIADAPKVGETQTLDIARLREVLGTRKVNLALTTLKGATTCQVSRPTDAPARPAKSPRDDVAAEAQTLQQAVESFLKTSANVRDGRLDLQFGHTAEQILELTDPPFGFDIRQTSGRTLGLVGLEVTLTTPRGETQSVPLMVNVSVVRRVVVATGPINLGDTVDPTQVKVIEQRTDNVSRPVLGDTAAVIGQRAKRYIRAGHPVQIRDLEPLPLVERNQIVEVISQSGGVAIRTAARCVDTGAYGEIVELRSGPRGQKRITATVVGPGRVQVGMPMPMDFNGTHLAQGSN